MQKFFATAGLLMALLTLGCNSQKVVTAPPMETRDLDTMTVTPATNGVINTETAMEVVEKEVMIPNERPVYNAAAERTNDLLHTRLELSFDWDKEMVIGVATLTLKPIFYPVRELTLDAKNFNFNSIRNSAGDELKFSYEGDRQQVTIDLDREYQRGQEYTIEVDYNAIPAQSGGSAAITSDKGLFFINPRGEEGADKPRQIWTQGETENNSRWFPTIDKPNERTTQTMIVTVKNEYKTLSNGTLTNSTMNKNGTRTDTWEMDQPHAPYLFMLTVGDFDIVEDEKWNGIPVNYYMEKGWKDHAKAIYPYTREMLTFFSDLTGVQYPWPKYSQVAVRDFVSGAMENTTAVIFGEFMHGTDRSLIDVETNEKIVAHEMFHHWFGDLVTCESWANLTLNEGFANYSEYLWMEKKHGRDAAENHMLEERAGYFGSLRRGGPKELIRYGYDDKEEMFDAHSYNKGGAALHMLREYLGDEAFFASLKKYLTDNQYSAVEVDELRMAFEDTTGKDLQWFFDQWYLSAGHPAISLSNEYSDGMVKLTVEQTQSPENNVPAIFRLPTKVAILKNGSTVAEMHDIVVDQRKQTFTFPSAVKPDVVIFDPQHTILANYDYTKSTSELAAQFRGAQSYIDRMLTVQRLANKEESEEKTATLTAALQDPFHAIRTEAMNAIEVPTDRQLKLMAGIAESDPHSATRATAIAALGEVKNFTNVEMMGIAKSAMNARPYPVVAAGLSIMASKEPQMALKEAEKLESVENSEIAASVASVYAEAGDVTKLSYFEKQMDMASGFGAIDLMSSYQSLLGKADPARILKGVETLKSLALNQGTSPWRRLGATAALNELRESSKTAEGKSSLVEQIGTIITAIKAAETEPQLKQIYGQFGN